jgi:aminomuconate-semialdehyde/2-hydroxymuconate-6-semialdehyde dehydrogenase
MERIPNFVDGEHVSPGAGLWLDNVEPATGRPYSLVARSDAADVGRAAEAARRAWPAWSRTPAAERSRLLLALASRIESDLERFARAESIDTGKPLALARAVDIPRAVANFRFFATAILHFSTETHVTDGLALNYTLRRPRGVAGLIAPWNLPLYLLSWKIAPALATGNTVLAKPSELTPMTAYLLTEASRDAGLPPGVLNVVHGLGTEAGAAIVDHPEVTTISFTGGTVTGTGIARAAALSLKKVTLEMGGKNPNLVFADADLDRAVPESVRAAFSNQGQICLCGSRILVERAVYEPFVERFVARARALVIGDPLDPATEQGAVVSQAHADKVVSYIDLARRENGTIRCGGGRPADLPSRCRDGFFVEPTVITDLLASCRVHREEIFGPVVTIAPFDGEDEAVELANDTPYGLSASVWTENLTRAHRLAERLDAGVVWINCWLVRDLRTPFGGMKASGLGREGGEEALRFFTEPRNVCLRTEG